MNALLYTRVSHEEQVKFGYSLDAQMESLEKYCEENGLTIKGRYTDEGISGASIDKRKALKRMLHDATSGDIILFTKLDRFSRNLLDANIIVQDLEKQNVGIKAIQEDDIDTTSADGKFIFNLKLSLAQRERDKTAERVREVMAYKRSHGQVASGTVPLGYRLVDKKVIIEPREAEIAKYIFETYDSTNSLQETYKRTTDKYGMVRCITSYRNILKSRTYIGQNRDGVQFCEPLIDEAMWNRVQKRLSKNLKFAPTGMTYLFSKMIVCPRCGCHLYGHRYSKNDKYIRYHCCSRNSKRGNCGYGSIREELVEDQLLTNIKLFANRQKHDFVQDDTSVEETKKDVQKLENKRKRLTELYVEGDIDKETYIEKKANLENEIQSLKATMNIGTSETIETLMGLNLKDIYYKLDRKRKSEFWHKFIDKIIIDENNNITDIIFHSDVCQ